MIWCFRQIYSKGICPYSLPSLHYFFSLSSCKHGLFPLNQIFAINIQTCYYFPHLKKYFSWPDSGHQWPPFFAAKPLESMSIIASNLSPLILSRKQSKQVFVSTETDLMNVSTDLGDVPKSNGPSLVSSYFTFS